MTDKPRVLVLGGTEFVGRHLVDALGDGWDITLFNRGRSNPDLFAHIPRLIGDRRCDVSALEGRAWDVVIDVTAYFPDDIDRIADALGENLPHYVFVSTVSAYRDLATPGITEDYPLATIDGPTPTESTGATYGPLKAAAEARVAARFPQHLIVRPDIIAGPHDPTWRVTYWIQRLSSPGTHIVPPDLDVPIQFIDVRDLTDWIAAMAQDRGTGVFNAAGPSRTFREVVGAIAAATGVATDVVPITEEQLAVEGLAPWTSLPLWLPPSEPDAAGAFRIDASKAEAAGLGTRPLVDLVAATHAWADSVPYPQTRYGIPAEQERDIVRRRAR